MDFRIETDKDGKAVKQLYYYMNYKAFVNVVKYKLHQIQKRIESQEREDSSKASYICSNETCRYLQWPCLLEITVQVQK